MEKKVAIDVAIARLGELLEKQPNLLSYASMGSDAGEGKKAAEFCIGFIQTYAAWLQENK
ncbi:hypothetical protein [Herbaspirillum sp. VT-16-41]|uniref:hypothetical protein n=1 Tax=Herbaspirillum sp. VT-16-41 TaxID=1953765 RepID=UPI0009823A20|nr:hypothetical protein [Herbaspirillum sp. VT-16-41]ONN64809.1 hypothetical protein BTM36_22165 [Herbaspirillum sp. VT-16-41]